MTVEEIRSFINANREKIADSNEWYIQYQQAICIYDAIVEDIESGSKTAATDLVIVTINDKVYPLNYGNADLTDSLCQFLYAALEQAVDGIQYNFNI